jgi:hypothetical protein
LNRAGDLAAHLDGRDGFDDAGGRYGADNGAAGYRSGREVRRDVIAPGIHTDSRHHRQPGRERNDRQFPLHLLHLGETVVSPFLWINRRKIHDWPVAAA